jgi:hypothetical protein
MANENTTSSTGVCETKQKPTYLGPNFILILLISTYASIKTIVAAIPTETGGDPNPIWTHIELVFVNSTKVRNYSTGDNFQPDGTIHHRRPTIDRLI